MVRSLKYLIRALALWLAAGWQQNLLGVKFRRRENENFDWIQQ